MPNIDLLSKFDDSTLLKAIRSSNRAKIERESRKKLSDQKIEATRTKG